MAGASSLMVLWLVAQPDAGAPVQASVPPPGIAAPLGRVGDVVEPPPRGGLPAGERVWVGQLEGCARDQAVYLSRFWQGAAEGAVQVEAWVRGLERRGPLSRWRALAPALVEAVRRARAAAPSGLKACAERGARGPSVTDSWRLSPPRAPKRLCAGDAGDAAALTPVAFVDPSRAGRPPKVAGWVLLSAAPEGRPDRCRPRLSAVFFDSKGQARFAYHADFGGSLTAELLDGPCRRLELAFDAARQQFVPQVHEGGLGCGGVRR